MPVGGEAVERTGHTNDAAKEPMTWKNSRPTGMVVSMAWVWLMKSTPRSRNPGGPRSTPQGSGRSGRTSRPARSRSGGGPRRPSRRRIRAHAGGDARHRWSGPRTRGALRSRGGRHSPAAPEAAAPGLLAGQHPSVDGHPRRTPSHARPPRRSAGHYTTGSCTPSAAPETARKCWTRYSRNHRGLVYGPLQALCRRKALTQPHDADV
jgi:hypothetical protein